MDNYKFSSNESFDDDVLEKPEQDPEGSEENVEIKQFHYPSHPHRTTGGDRFKEIKEKIAEFFANPKKRKVFFGIVAAVIIALFGLGFYFLTGKNESPTENNVATDTTSSEETGTTQAPLDGVLTSDEAANRHPIAVVVENHPDARPQSGLDKASLVYEAIAEGGITRFMALFGTKESEKVGPVRSARTYFVDWSRGYNAYLSHVGGNIDALDQIKAEKILDLDQFRYPSSYWREKTRDVATEHTMYVSTNKLRDQATKNSYDKANNFTVYKFKDDPTVEENTATSQKITVNFSQDQYKAVFEYDKASNSYKRFMAGEEHKDLTSKNQITPKNVVVMTVRRQPTVTRINESGYDMTVVGTGPAKIFLDGKTINGTWKKNSKTDREIFYDESGKEVVFNRGQFWISVIHPEASVTIE